MNAKIVVVGAGYAGMLATLRLAKRGARVTLVNASDELVNRIRLHEVAAGSEPVRRPLARMLRGTGAELRVARVARIDTSRRRVELEDEGALEADFVVLAAGSVSDTRGVPGAAEHAHTLAGHDAAIALSRAAARGGTLVVCGGGPTAVEAAAELAERHGGHGLRVQLVTRGRILSAAGPTARAYALGALARLGVEVIEDTGIVAVERDAVITGAGRLPFTTCLWASGFVASPLARASGLPVDERGQLAVEATLAVPGLPWLYAAGDVARPRDHEGAPTEMSCKCALPMGGTVARNLLAQLAGDAPQPLRFGDSGMCISLGRRDAVVHLRRRDGADRGRIYSGRAGAWIKEGIARYVTGSLAVERVWPGAYRWLAPARQLPAADVDVAS